MKFQANFYVLSLLLTTVLATVADLENDVQAITSQVQSLNNEVTNFANIGGSVTSAAVYFPSLTDVVKFTNYNFYTRLSMVW